MPQLVNSKTNQVEDLPQDQAPAAFLSGTHNLIAGQKVPLNDPNGNPVTVDASEVNQAITEGGYTVPTQAQLQDAIDQQQYGEGKGNEIKAGLLGAARSASFGLSDQLLTKSGLVHPETISKLSKYNPIATGAGEAAGIVAPMLAGDEAGPLNLVKGVSKVGTATEKAASELLPEATTTARKVLASGAAKGLGSAVEGAAYGAGQVVSEDALGDPDLTAQSAIAQIGLSSLLGGGLGSVIGAGEVGIPKVLNSAKDSIIKTYDTARGAAGDLYAKTSSAVSGLPEETISEVLANRQLAFASPEERTKVASSLASSLDEQYSTTENALKSVYKDVRPIESEALASAADSTAAQAEYQRVFNLVDSTVKEMRSQPELYPARYPKKLETIQDSLTRDISSESSPSAIFSKLDELKQNLDTNIKFGKIPSDESLDAVATIKALRAQVKNSLTNEGVFGGAATRQSAFNEAVNEYKTALKEFQKNFMYKTQTKTGGIQFKINPVKVNTYFNQINDTRGALRGQVLDNFNNASKKLIGEIEQSYQNAPAHTFDKGAVEGLVDKSSKLNAQAQKQASISKMLSQIGSHDGGVGEIAAGAVALHNPVLGAGIEAYSMLKNPGQTITRLANLERLIQKTAKNIETGIKTLLSGSVKGYNVSRGEISAGLGSDFGKSQENSLKTFEKRVTEINKLAAPENLHGKLEASTSDLYDHAPNISAGLQKAAVAGVSFLASKIPKPAQQGPLSPEYQPNAAEISRFNRYYEAVQNPTSILKQAASGTLTQEALEAVKTVYPKLYERITETIAEKLGSTIVAPDKKPVPYRSKLMLAMMLGQNLDGSTTPFSISANQMIMTGGIQPPRSNGIRPTQKGLSNLTISNRTLTAQQATSRR